MELFLSYLASLLVSTALIIYGYFAVFKQTQLVQFYLRSSTKKGAEPPSYLIWITERSWFYLNLKICGTVCMLMGTAIFVYVTSIIINRI